MRGTKGGITAPRGFLAGGISCGIKKTGREDLTLIYSPSPSRAAGVFTLNRLSAWPLEWSREKVRFPHHHAIIGSSGNANCFNGPSGRLAVKAAALEVSRAFDILPQSILIAQTGVIGRPFPVERLTSGLKTLCRTIDRKGTGAARGILTTDTCIKEFALSFRLGARTLRIGSIAKGSGMIHPNMATMLMFVTTDACLSKPLLGRLLRRAVGETLNRMSVDNDMSTNDCVLVLANGRAGNRELKSEGEARLFYEALREICNWQRTAIVSDGEGVTKVCTLRIVHAASQREGERIARQIANSMLFKTMLAGADPNWGRVAAAIGATGAPVDFQKIVIRFDGVPVLKSGSPQLQALGKLSRILRKDRFTLEVDLKMGREQIDFVTSDLTEKYVKINAEYTT